MHINLFVSEREALAGYPKLTFRADIKLKIKVNPPQLERPREVMKIIEQIRSIVDTDELEEGMAKAKKITANKRSNLLQLNPASEPSDKHQSMTTYMWDPSKGNLMP